MKLALILICLAAQKIRDRKKQKPNKKQNKSFLHHNAVAISCSKRRITKATVNSNSLSKWEVIDIEMAHETAKKSWNNRKCSSLPGKGRLVRRLLPVLVSDGEGIF